MFSFIIFLLNKSAMDSQGEVLEMNEKLLLLDIFP